MLRRSISSRGLFALAALGCLAVPTLLPARQVPPPPTPAPQVELEIDADQLSYLVGEDGRMHFFVELAGTPAALTWADRLAEFPVKDAAARAAATSAAAAQLAANQSAQELVASQLASVDATEVYRLGKVANGFVVQAEPDALARLQSLPGVRRVFPVEPEVIHNSTSVPFIGTTPAWGDTLGLGVNLRGEGISIGIIDTGVDYQHTHFGGTGLNADYVANDRAVAPDAYFPTAKVVGGWDFAGDTYNAAGNGGTTGSTTPVPDPDPMDCNRHGTHVAGTAAGYGVNADGTTFAGPWDGTVPFGSLRIGPGVAPQAEIYALRVFGCTGSTSLTAQAIEWAADPNGDTDFSDHLDVINMSLGSNHGSISDLTALTSDAAAAVGVVVVASAGNAGDTFFITGSPGAGSRVISVAASADDGLAGAALVINSPAGIAGSYAAAAAVYTNAVAPQPPAPSGQTGNIILVDDGSTAGGGTINDGCQTPFVNAAAVAGNIALIDRGVCGFIQKAQNAQANGAIAVIIANNAAGDPVPNVMGGTGATPSITIPGVSIAQATRATIVTALGSGTVNGTLPGGITAADTVATFSSRGPRRASSPIKLKPEISAPGSSITSAQTGVSSAGGSCVPTCPVSFANAGLNASLVLSGTSMAAPHMAGVMALLRQLHPTWAVEELKALAMNYANHDLYLGGGNSGPRYAPSRIGAGRVDVSEAVLGEVIAMSADDPGLVAVSFGTEVVNNLVLTRTIRVVNHGTTAQTFDLAIDAILDAPGVTVSLPGGNSVLVPAGGTVELPLQLSANANAMDNAYDPTMATGQAVAAPAGLAGLGALARHRMNEETGYVTFSQGGNLQFRLPYYSAPRPASTMAGGDIVTGGAGSGSTTIPLTGVDFCTGTLGAGPTCSGTLPTEEVPLVTPFELQLVSPRNPDLAPFGGYADIQHVGVAADAAGTNIYFGVSSWEAWSSPNETVYNIWIDNNEDGTWDHVVFNASLGQVSARLFGSANDTQQDNFLSFRFTPPGTVGSQFFINASPATADTELHNSAVVLIPVQATAIGLNAGNNNFRYRVESCPWFQPLCSALPGFVVGNGLDNTGAGFATWDRTARGLDFGGGSLFFDLNGATLPVTWNTANLATNGSFGALLLHHHNTVGTQSQVVLLDTATSADLAITKSASPVNPVLGDNVTFTVTVTNQGPDSASGIVVVDPLPAGLTYVSDTGAGAYNSTTGEWTIPGSLANAASTNLQIVATLDTTEAVTNTATIGAGTPLDPDPSDNVASVTINAPESADLALAMVTDVPTVLVGGTVVFTLTVENLGSDPAYGIDVNESFPTLPALNPTSSVASQGVYNPATGLWDLASLGSGNSATLALTFTAPNMAGPLTNDGTASAAANDPDTANNDASATVTVLSPATVTARKSVSGTFNEGGTVTYSVVLSNSAAYDQQNNPGDEFTDVLPASLTLVSASASSGTALATIGTNTVTWNGVVPAGGSVTVTITATIDAGTAGTTISNQGGTASDVDGNGLNEGAGVTDDPGLPGATDPTSFYVLSPASLAATKAVAGGTYQPGDAVVYTIVLTNNAAFPQTDNPGDELVDVLPGGLALVSASATSGTAVATVGTNTVTWNGAIAAAASVTITINATVTAAQGNIVANQGTVNFDSDGNGTNDSTVQTDDPNVGGASDATLLTVGSVLDIPTVGEVGLLALLAALAAAATLRLRRRQQV